LRHLCSESDVHLGRQNPEAATRYPKATQRGPKASQRQQNGPQSKQNGPQSGPRTAKGSPRAPQREPKGPQSHTKGSQAHPKGSQRDKIYISNSRSTAPADVINMALSDLIMSLSALIPYPPTEEKKITFPCQMFFATKRLHMEALGPSISAFCVIFRCASFRTGHLVGNHSFDKTMFYLHNTPHSKNSGREKKIRICPTLDL